MTLSHRKKREHKKGSEAVSRMQPSYSHQKNTMGKPLTAKPNNTISNQQQPLLYLP
jgi:hypothetical protein